MPSRVRILRDSPLPDGVPMLLRIAAGDEVAEREAAASLDRPAQVVRDASVFYIEQLLLYPEADSYRVLGADPKAPTAELRQNMAHLIRWLHPDKNPMEERAVFVNRVNRAWDDLKTPDRREAYDRMLASRSVPKRHGLSPDTSRRPTKTSSTTAADTGHAARHRVAPGATHKKTAVDGQRFARAGKARESRNFAPDLHLSLDVETLITEWPGRPGNSTFTADQNRQLATASDATLKD